MKKQLIFLLLPCLLLTQVYGQQAMARFNEVLNVNPKDSAAEIYAQNAQHYISDGVYENWEGAL
jgi:hypothetical protein